jgi:curved DNA-binding protein
MGSKDYYELMGIKSDASSEDIKKSYRRLARKYHPDLNKEPDAENNFKALGEAYEVLKDPIKRQQYDQMRASAHYQDPIQDNQAGRAHTWSEWRGESPTAGEFNADLFESLFRGARPNHGGGDIHGKITISLREAYEGVVREIVLSKSGIMPSETQKIRVKIPPGVRSEQQIRLAGLGEPGRHGGSNGDLYVTVIVQRDPLFDVVDNDIYMTLPVTPWEAALGANVKVPTLAGLVDLKIPKHSQAGQKLRLKNRGLNGKNPGDQYVLLKIVIPQPSSNAAEALYQTMAKEMPFNPRDTMERQYG